MRAKLKFEHNVGAHKWFMQTEFGSAGYETKILLAENSQKVDDFESIHLGNYRY